MKSDKERLGWILRFVEIDLAHLRAGDWLNLQEDVRDFLGWFSFQEITLEQMRPLQEETKAILLNLVRGNFPPATMPQDAQHDSQSPGAQRVYRRPVRRKTDSVALTYTTEEGTHRYLD